MDGPPTAELQAIPSRKVRLRSGEELLIGRDTRIRASGPIELVVESYELVRVVPQKENGDAGPQSQAG